MTGNLEQRRLARIGLTLTLALVVVAPAWAGFECPEDPLAGLPATFPLDVFVFRAEVIDPVVDLSEPSGAVGVRVELSEPVHLPQPRKSFVLDLFGVDCQRVERQQLIDRFRSGDELEVVAFPRPGGGAVLESSFEWVRFVDENVTRGIDTTAEYFTALLALDTKEDESERIVLLRSLAEYVTDSEAYQRILKAHLKNRSLRRQLTKVHKVLAESRG